MKYKAFLTIFVCLVQIGVAQEIELDQVREYDADFSFPSDICGNNEGEVYVLDGMNNRVVILRSNGRIDEIIPQRESFYKSVGIAWIKNALWIADTPRSRLLRMELNGRISKIVELSHGTEPVGITAVGNNIALTDRVNHAITVVDENTREKYYWGKRGEKIGQFINPSFLTTDSDNRLVISDMLNRRVVSYSQSGRFPQMIAKPGVEQGQVFRPKGIGIDSKNQIWIVDGYTGSLQSFSQQGKFLGVATHKHKTIQLNAPMGVWVDTKDQLWVVESRANKVSVWQLK